MSADQVDASRVRDDVTVVIPAFQSAEWIPYSLGSIAAQTVLPGTVIVVDDGSTDDLATVVALTMPSAVVVSQRNLGLAAARNRGLAEATTRWVAFLDSDDCWHPRRLERMLAFLDGQPAVRVLGTDAVRFCTPDDQGARAVEPTLHVLDPFELIAGTVEIEPLRPLEEVPSWTPTLKDYYRNNWVNPNVLADRVALITAGGFPTHTTILEDWFTWTNLARTSPLTIMRDPTFYYRQRPRSMSRTTALPMVWLVNLVAQLHSGRDDIRPGSMVASLGSDCRWLVHDVHTWARNAGGVRERRSVRRLGTLVAGSRREMFVQRFVELEVAVRWHAPGLSSRIARTLPWLRRRLHLHQDHSTAYVDPEAS